MFVFDLFHVSRFPLLEKKKEANFDNHPPRFSSSSFYISKVSFVSLIRFDRQKSNNERLEEKIIEIERSKTQSLAQSGKFILKKKKQKKKVVRVKDKRREKKKQVNSFIRSVSINYS